MLGFVSYLIFIHKRNPISIEAAIVVIESLGILIYQLELRSLIYSLYSLLKTGLLILTRPKLLFDWTLKGGLDFKAYE